MSEPILRVESIDTFYGPSHVLHGVSMAVERGEAVALVGRNGAGKTTTLRSIMGLTPPSEGRIVLNGEEVQGLAPHDIRQRGISWVPEDRRVFPSLTVAENVSLAAGAGKSETPVESVYERFPRLDERRDQKAGTMSGGEQQMLAIARALVGPETDVLMLDEPSEGLAPQIVDDVADAIRALNADGVTVLLVEQNAEMALGLADRAYVLDTGRIKYEGDAEELRTDREIMESYLGIR